MNQHNAGKPTQKTLSDYLPTIGAVAGGITGLFLSGAIAEAPTVTVEPSTQVNFFKFLESPQTWAVFLIFVFLYGVYRLGVIMIPEWIKAQKEIAEKQDAGKKERAVLYIEGNRKNYELICDNMKFVGESLKELTGEVKGLTAKCHEKFGMERNGVEKT